MRTLSVRQVLACCALLGCSEDPTPSTALTAGQSATQTAGTSAATTPTTMTGMTGTNTSPTSSASAGTGTKATGGMMAMNTMTPSTGGMGGAPAQTAGMNAGEGGAAPMAGTGGMEPMKPAAECPESKMPNPMGADPCTSPLRPGEDRKCMFSYMGQMRKFYIYAPMSYNPCEPASLVMDCHGASESAEVHIGVDRFSADAPLGYGSSWRRAVQGDNAIVVTPEGTGLRWSATSDPPFLNTIADMIEKVAKVNPDRRYITGISMGGMVTVATGCQDTSRWRAMIPVAMLSQSCNSIKKPVPHMAFHATGDQLTSYSDDQRLAENMAKLNGCDMTPTTVYYGGPNSSKEEYACFKEKYGLGSPDAKDPYNIPLSACPTDRPESNCKVWAGCDEGVEVRFCTVAASTQQLGGHLLYRNDTSLALGPLSWAFLKKFWK